MKEMKGSSKHAEGQSERRRPVLRQGSVSGPEILAQIKAEKKVIKERPVKEYPLSIAGMLKKIANIGIPLPTKPEHLHEYDWPLDITKVPNHEIRAMMSYYAAHSNYAAHNIALISNILDKLEQQLKSRTRKLRAKYSQQRMKVAEASGKIEEDELINRIENAKLHGKEVLRLLESAKEGYDRNIQVASRELSARDSEMRNIGRHS